MSDISSSVGLIKYRSWLHKDSVSLQCFIFINKTPLQFEYRNIIEIGRPKKMETYPGKKCTQNIERLIYVIIKALDEGIHVEF